ncbi:MAG: DUF115 domain-containing protein [Ignavibacteriales bacterium]|nr:DUF115 domain-containing protein [Ignavibacteriales bacterium]
MKNIINKILIVIKEDGLLNFFNKAYRNIINIIKRALYFDISNKKKIINLKNKFKGERVFLIGNGPSLNITPLYLLKNEYTVAFNRFNIMFERLSWKPNFYVLIDSVVAKDMANEINEITALVDYSFFPDVHTDGTIFKKFIKKRENVLWVKPGFGNFLSELPKIVLGGTVSFAAIQILTFLGFKEIILIGVDMNYQIHSTVETKKGTAIKAKYDDDPNHFDPRYFGSNRSYHQPDKLALTSMFNAFEIASIYSKQNGVKIINAGYDSALTCFPVKEFTSLFNYNYKDKLNLFLESLGINEDFESLQEALPSLTEVIKETDWNDESEYLLVDQTIAQGMIKKKIFTHIPFGPYENKYVFKKRS